MVAPKSDNSLPTYKFISQIFQCQDKGYQETEKWIEKFKYYLTENRNYKNLGANYYNVISDAYNQGVEHSESYSELSRQRTLDASNDYGDLRTIGTDFKILDCALNNETTKSSSSNSSTSNSSPGKSFTVNSDNKKAKKENKIDKDIQTKRDVNSAISKGDYQRAHRLMIDSGLYTQNEIKEVGNKGLASAGGQILSAFINANSVLTYFGPDYYFLSDVPYTGVTYAQLWDEDGMGMGFNIGFGIGLNETDWYDNNISFSEEAINDVKSNGDDQSYIFKAGFTVSPFTEYDNYQLGIRMISINFIGRYHNKVSVIQQFNTFHEIKQVSGLELGVGLDIGVLTFLRIGCGFTNPMSDLKDQDGETSFLNRLVSNNDLQSYEDNIRFSGDSFFFNVGVDLVALVNVLGI